MSLEYLVPIQGAVQYTGSNSTEVLGFCPDLQGNGVETLYSATIESENDGVLIIAYANAPAGGYDFILNTGDWMGVKSADAWGDGPNVLIRTEHFDDYYVKLSDIG